MNEITCPFCGRVSERDDEDMNWYEGEYEKDSCDSCDKEFLVTVNHTITFDTIEPEDEPELYAELNKD